MKVFLRFLISLPLYFLGIIVVHALFKLDYGVRENILAALMWGFALGVVLFGFVCRFKRVYIFGHELAHWIFAKAFMKETGRFSVGKHGGGVEVKDPNMWVVLAPYFYPTFTIIWLPVWFVFKSFQNDFEYGLYVYFGVLALTWAYHLVLTLYALKFEQSDIQRCGKPLSFSVIFLINMLFIYTFLAFVTNGPLESVKLLWSTLLADCENLSIIMQGSYDGLQAYLKDL